MPVLIPLLFLLFSVAAQADSPSPLEARLVRLARETVHAAVEHTTAPVSEERTPPRPVFVTIERGGEVLGCRGSLVCRTSSLEEEVRLAARSAAAHDPRYRPLMQTDLSGMQVTVTVVERLEPLAGEEAVATLGPEAGLVLKCGERTGVVLPWEGRDPALRLKWAYRKAGVAPGAACRLYRLVATRVRG